MCRLYGFRANEPTKVECTLVHAQNALLIQSRADLRGVEHADGWGIAYFGNGEPSTERRASAAHADVYFSETAERLYAKTVVAHIRRATVGGNSLANTHPYQFGSWVFAHNGTLTGFEGLREDLVRETDPALQRCRLGSTDSEQIFYWLLTRMVKAGIAPRAPADDVPALVDVVARAIQELAARSERQGPDKEAKLNLLLTNGRMLVASCWGNSLHWVERHGVHDCEICGIPHVLHQPQHDYRAVVIASEPISHESWQSVPRGRIVAVSPNVGCRLYAI